MANNWTWACPACEMNDGYDAGFTVRLFIQPEGPRKGEKMVKLRGSCRTQWDAPYRSIRYDGGQMYNWDRQLQEAGGYCNDTGCQYGDLHTTCLVCKHCTCQCKNVDDWQPPTACEGAGPYGHGCGHEATITVNVPDGSDAETARMVEMHYCQACHAALYG